MSRSLAVRWVCTWQNRTWGRALLGLERLVFAFQHVAQCLEQLLVLHHKEHAAAAILAGVALAFHRIDGALLVEVAEDRIMVRPRRGHADLGVVLPADQAQLDLLE